jgi:hypothetical protein
VDRVHLGRNLPNRLIETQAGLEDVLQGRAADAQRLESNQGKQQQSQQHQQRSQQDSLVKFHGRGPR